MACVQMRWPAPDLVDLLFVLAGASRESPFSPRITLQIIGGKLLANAPYAFIGSDYDLDGAVLEVIFPADRLTNIEIELRRLQLHYDRPQTLDSYVRLERCLRYSIAWRLPPVWNQVEHKLVMGDKFLEEGKNYHWFVEFNLSVSSKIVLTISDCGMIRLRPLTMEALFPKIRNNKSERVALEKRLADETAVTCEPFPCFVLPSLNEALIIAVAWKPFGIIDTTQKMSSYWTGRYGYRLDGNLSADGSFYCEVVFAKGSRFLYPHCCLKLDRGSVVHRHSNHHVLSDFQRSVGAILAHAKDEDSVADVIKFNPALVCASEVADLRSEV